MNSDQTLQLSSHSMEKIEQRLEFYRSMLVAHPLFELAKNQQLPREVINEFAYLQYVDSILWVPMLALMKERVKNPKLARALRDNLACEAGYSGTSHIELARRFIQSLGVNGSAFGYINPDVVENASHWTSFSEAQIAGWLYAAETLVPILFSKMKICYFDIPGADLHYLNAHIEIDSDEHSQWMKEAVTEILQNSSTHQDVLLGIDFGAREALDVPDSLYTKALWLKRK